MHVRAHIWSVIWLAILVGCGGPHESYVAGSVTLDGEALPGGTIMFHPQAGGPLVTGTIQEDGSYKLATGATAGLAPGRYVVTVRSFTQIPAPGMTPAQLEAISRAPGRYAEAATSGFSYEIQAGANSIDIEMESN